MSHAVAIRHLTKTLTAVARVTTTPAEASRQVGQLFSEVWDYLSKNGIHPSGAAFARVAAHGEQVELEVGFSVDQPIKGNGRVRPGELPGGEAAIAVSTLPYERLSDVHSEVQAWIAANGRQAAGPPWEVYLSGPGEPPKTEVVWPLA